MRRLLPASFSVVLTSVAAFGQVTGQPYSAEQVSEHTQTLSDGTHISQRRTIQKVYRDSAGRTRMEHFFPGPSGTAAPEGPARVEITDPVAGYRYVLDSSSKTAHRTVIPTSPAGRLVGNGAGVSARTIQPVRPETSTESLGTQVIDGIIVEGRRMTHTFAAGTQGNDRPIVVTSETWTSPELKITLLYTDHDPRSGDNTNKLENLSRAEPDPALFQPPADYQIVDETGAVSFHSTQP